jgi:glutathione synthase/RimK-type ligase-like ATP-grasp enzyme
MSGIVVVDQRSDWPVDTPGVEVVTAWDYLTRDEFTRGRRTRIYNLCRSFAYQSTGYYVSLLAGARDHRPLPDITTVQDLKLREGPRVLNDEVETLLQQSLAPLESDRYVLHAYFGRCPSKRHERLARALFNLFPSPLLMARMVRRDGEWRVEALGPIALGEVPENQTEFLYEMARDYFTRRRAPRRTRDSSRYDLAILVNPSEEEPPSNAKALKAFEKAAEARGFDVEFVDKSDYGHLAEFDALFIRETTAVNHHTYRFARRAAREGLVVIDDPESILRCSNKVFLAQLMARHRIATPKTMLIHSRNLSEAASQLGFPCVLKQPDSAFSRGVIKVDSAGSFRRAALDMLERSDLIVAQAFEPTDYDWRVGVIGGKAFYACRYYMAKDHWQIVKRDDAGAKAEGQHETVAIADAPPKVVRAAVEAARAIGDGLYGVDLKQMGDRVKVIEVNDNPNMDVGVEDQVLGDALFAHVIDHILARLEARR